jgi:hypothetical protein
MVVDLINRREEAASLHVAAEGRVPPVPLNSDSLTDSLLKAVGAR